MADYTELVSALRECSKQGTRYGMAVIYMEQAADDIEYLVRKLEARESSLASVSGCLGNSKTAMNDVLDTADDRIT